MWAPRVVAALGAVACRPDDEVRITATPTEGVFPLEVAFQGSADGAWDFGDGATGQGATATHTYVGAGGFDVSLTTDDGVGTARITVETPTCPATDAPEIWGVVGDASLDELSGIASSRREPGMYWVNQDNGKNPLLFGLDPLGRVLSSHDLDGVDDLEDIATAVDPVTGEPLLFAADIGDNDAERSEIAVFVLDEPDPFQDGDLHGLRMVLRYPTAAHNAETLLVDPRTLDLYVVTKDRDGEALVFVKRAPHDGLGPYVLEEVGALSFARAPLSGLTTTGGDVSPDGSRVVVRTYLPTGYLWIRDGYLPLESAFEGAPCPLRLASETQGEAVGFTADGAGLVTVSEGEGEPLFHVGLVDR